MAYQVTARKWRPKNFVDNVGQSHITTTLKNAIELKKISQSYLFAGPRGVGKTTISRILAKSLNCINGPTTTPCEQCEYCLGVNNDSSLDYREIDGASNRGIDQIREINDNLKYVSSQNKYKVIVIDEVHMLTKEAFNALLKNLEEPPEKVVFVFCTTEIQKIPQTILSRCQYYEFRPFSIDEISTQLKKILDHEKITYEEQAIFLIAKNGAGSMRDSQSTLDQLIAYSQNNITTKNVQDVLGINDSQIYFNFLSALFKQDLKTNHSFIQTYIEGGHVIRHFFYDLIDSINSIVFIKNGVDTPKDLQLTKEDFQALQSLSSMVNLEDLFLINEILFNLLEELKTTLSEKITLEYFLIKLHRYPSLIDPGALKDQLIKIVNSTSGNSTDNENNKVNIEKKDIQIFLNALEKKLDCSIVGFTKPFLTIAGNLDKTIEEKIIKKIKQDYDFDVKLNILEKDKKAMKHLHNAFVEFNSSL